MARGPLITPAERAKIAELAPSHGIRGTAAILHRSPHAITDVVHQDGIVIHMWAENRAARALQLLGRERRLGLLAGIADEVEHQLGGAPARIPAKDLRDLAVSLGVSIDKQRLEEGLSSFNAAAHITTFGARELPGAG